MSVDLKQGTVWWLYQARRVATQANVAGGRIALDILIAIGQIAKLVQVHGANSGTNSLVIDTVDEDGAQCARLLVINSAAGVQGCAPNVGTTGVTANISESPGMLFGPGISLSVNQGAAGAQNDTLTVYVALLLSTPTVPTWSKARSTNEADVTIAASTISVANTLQAVYMP